ncbi:MAG: NUMOD3 domain-containing DNA-binding protein, partial [Atribacterota bacterium]
KWFNNLSKEEHKDWYEITFTDIRNKNLSSSLKGKKKDKEHVDKINKNPEKIKKTANKHIGMKRSDEARKNMSKAKKGKTPHNKGKVYCYDPKTLEKKLCFIDEMPDGYVRGFVKKCKY